MLVNGQGKTLLAIIALKLIFLLRFIILEVNTPLRVAFSYQFYFCFWERKKLIKTWKNKINSHTHLSFMVKIADASNLLITHLEKLHANIK